MRLVRSTVCLGECMGLVYVCHRPAPFLGDAAPRHHCLVRSFCALSRSLISYPFIYLKLIEFIYKVYLIFVSGEKWYFISVLLQSLFQDQPLWKLCRSDHGDIQQYYVPELAPHVVPPLRGDSLNITMHRHLSQIPGRLNITQSLVRGAYIAH